MFATLSAKKESNLEGSAFKEQFKITKNAILLDVRTPGEFRSGTIPGAENLDVMAADFKSRIKKLSPQNVYFVFCRSGNRSAGAVTLLEEQGLKAFNLIGGIGDWPRG